MTRPYDVIVAGVGTMGAATCLAATRRGARVLGLDRFAPPHSMGSHHGHTRLFRMAYYEHPDYVPLLKRARELWERLNVECGEQVFIRTGALYAGDPEGPLVRGTLEAARAHGLPVARLEPGEAKRRYPQFSFADGHEILYDEDGAMVLCEHAVAQFVRMAIGAGAEIRTNEPVLSWHERGGLVRVRTPAGECSGGALILTCGARGSSLAPTLRAPLVVTRQVLGWVRPTDPGPFLPGRLPVWARENDDGSLYYGAPLAPGEPGVKVARHAKGEPTDPDLIDRAPRAADGAEILDGVDRCLPSLTREIAGLAVCMYTNSPDSNFIIDRVPGTSRVHVACGFSGHGFKFAPAIGEAMADLVLAGGTALPIGFLSASRFGG